jgi:hypothetical protein
MRSQTRSAGNFRARRRQRRTKSAHPRPPRRRLDHRRRTWSTRRSTGSSATAVGAVRGAGRYVQAGTGAKSSTNWATGRRVLPSCGSAASVFRKPICLADKRNSNTNSPKDAKWSRGGQRFGSATLGTFEQTRPMVAAQAIGIARAALEYARSYATQREAFGGPIINQGIAFPLADLVTQIDAARLLTWRASWMAADGAPFERGRGRDIEARRQRGRRHGHRTRRPPARFSRWSSRARCAPPGAPRPCVW